MPELPEVETVARALDHLLSNRRIIAAQLIREKLAPHSPPDRFSEKLSNAKINFVHRRGKHLLFDLDNGRTLLTHLRMTGRFMLLPNERPDPKFAHAVFHLDTGRRLVFDDQRHFGMMRIVDTGRLYMTEEILKLAPEPFSDEFSPNYLHENLRRSKRTVKEFLLDQTKVCGLGNIYAGEALFRAGISPVRKACRISRQSAAVLREHVIAVLAYAISKGAELGFDEEDISGSIYGSGSAAAWQTYGRGGEPCYQCGQPISRIVQGGRSTFYCRKCQR